VKGNRAQIDAIESLGLDHPPEGLDLLGSEMHLVLLRSATPSTMVPPRALAKETTTSRISRSRESRAAGFGSRDLHPSVSDSMASPGAPSRRRRRFWISALMPE